MSATRASASTRPLHIDHENDDIRRIDGNLRLLAHLTQEDIIRFGLDSAGINQRKIIAVQFTSA